MDIIYGIICIVIGAIIVYLIVRPKLKSVAKADAAQVLLNEQLKNENSLLKEDIASLKATQAEIQSNIYQLENEGMENAKKISKDFYEQSMQVAINNLDSSLGQKAIQYQEDEQDYQNEYLKTLQDYVNEFQKQTNDKQEEIKQLNETLSRLRALVTSIVEEQKRKTIEKEQSNFYRLTLSEEDINEIAQLRKVLPYLRDKEPLNKVIYKCYYEKPYNELIGRVVGKQQKTGIYKITNINNNMCYVGQAVDIAERWRQHIKRGVGAETATRNKLYPIMYKIGVENFTFEILEECSKAELNEREDYYQDFYHAIDYGYSIK